MSAAGAFNGERFTASRNEPDEVAIMLRSDSREFKSRLPKYTIRFSANATWLQLLKTLGIETNYSLIFVQDLDGNKMHVNTPIGEYMEPGRRKMKSYTALIRTHANPTAAAAFIKSLAPLKGNDEEDEDIQPAIAHKGVTNTLSSYRLRYRTINATD